MKLKTFVLGINSGGRAVVILNKIDAGKIGTGSSGRVKLHFKKDTMATVNLSSTLVEPGHVGVNDEVMKMLSLESNSLIDVEIAEFPKSLQFIRYKLAGRKLLYEEIYEIVKDLVKGNLNENEIASFVTSLQIRGLDLDEATSLSLSMVRTGRQLNFRKKIVMDKHSIGGVPGDKTSLLVVPTVAAAGITIPKTSSRAITSAAGTADRAESLMPVNLGVEEMKHTVQKSNGCLIWGGALELAPADDIFVRTEYSLHIDPLLLPSIMSKKKAVGATHLVVDIPAGRGAKVKTVEDADLLAKDLIELGRRLKIHTNCLITFGEQPIGFTIGPALEAREALEVLMNRRNIPDLVDKACHIAGAIFETVGKKNGYRLAREILRSGRSEKKLRQIISLQGGNPDIKPEDLPIATESLQIKAKKSGYLLWMDNNSLVEIARAAGAPKDKKAGIVFNKKCGQRVTRNDVLFTVYSEKSRKISRTLSIIEDQYPVSIGKPMEMLIHKMKESQALRKEFFLER